MKRDILVLEEMYRQQQIHYLVHGDTDEMMYNATDMAKIFGKQTYHFLENNTTLEFINVCCQDENFHEIFGFGTEIEMLKNDSQARNSEFETKILTFEERKNLLVNVQHGGHNKGTWMQETIALDFAAWLDPNFKFWMNRQIRKITIGYYADHKKANLKLIDAKAREALYRDKIRIDPSVDNYKELIKAIDEIDLYSKQKAQAIRNQTKLDL